MGGRRAGLAAGELEANEAKFATTVLIGVDKPYAMILRKTPHLMLKTAITTMSQMN
jgi:hypothetical protein